MRHLPAAMRNRKIAEVGAHPPQIANFTRVITACMDFISKMLRSENEHHATCRRARDDYDPHKGHHVDEHHSSQNSTGFTADQITWSAARVSCSHTDPRRATSSAHRSWRRSTTSLARVAGPANLHRGSTNAREYWADLALPFAATLLAVGPCCCARH